MSQKKSDEGKASTRSEGAGVRARSLFPDIVSKTPKADLQKLVFAEDGMAHAILNAFRREGVEIGDARQKVISEIRNAFCKGKDGASEGTLKAQVQRGLMYLRIVEGLQRTQTERPKKERKSAPKGKKTGKTKLAPNSTGSSANTTSQSGNVKSDSTGAPTTPDAEANAGETAVSGVA